MLDKILVGVKLTICYITTGLILFLLLLQTHATKSVDDIVRIDYDKFINISKECGELVNDKELRVEVDYTIEYSSYYAIFYPVYNIVTINYYNFIKLSMIHQQQVVFHELGHALLGLPHNDVDLNLMNTLEFIGEKDYKKNYDYYLRKLFVNCKKKGEFVYGQ